MADVHWRGLSRHEEYKTSFEDAFEKMRLEEPDAIFIAGDIVHSKTQGISPELINYLNWFFTKLNEIATTIVMLGNHDGLVLNKNREDAISPIIRAMNLPNVILLKGTTKFSFDDNIEISNFCPFDEEGWPELEPTPGKINIALFHGVANGVSTDDEWVIESDIDYNFFNKYDFAFLGDIHKRQYIDPNRRFLYPGSVIQQNHGETPNKGFTVWNIKSANDFSDKHVVVNHEHPFVTIDWKGSIAATLDEAEPHRDGSRFRIRSNVLINQVEIKQLYSSLKEFKNAKEVVLKYDIDNNKNSNTIEFDKNSRLNLRDDKVVADLILKYNKKIKLNKSLKSEVATYVKKFMSTIPSLEAKTDPRWSLKRLEFENTFGYGKDNVINFDELEGVVGLFGPNRAGKSSICGTLMYTLFNTTDRGSISNLHVINTRKGYCKSKATISKSGKIYEIERQSVKKESRKNGLSAVTHLNLYEVDNDGNVINDLCDEQRKDTEKVVRNLIGTPEDFLLTAFASQNEMNTFIEQRATARKSILTKFLELDIFDHIYNQAMEESSELRQLMKKVSEKDFDFILSEEKNRLHTVSLKREECLAELEVIKNNLKRSELNLATRSDSSLVAPSELQKVVSEKNKLENSLDMLTEKLEQLTQEYELINSKIEKLDNIKNAFPLTEIENKISEKNNLDKSHSKLEFEISSIKNNINIYKKQSSILDDVPCGDDYPKCPFIVNAHKSKKKLIQLEEELDALKEQKKDVKNQLENNDLKNAEENYKKYKGMISKYNEFRLKSSNKETQLSEIRNKLNNTKNKIVELNLKIDKMKANLATEDDTKHLKELREEISASRNRESQLEKEIRLLSERVGLLQASIKKTKKDKKEYEEYSNKWKVFECITGATSKNGIPLEIIRTRLPEINSEIAAILHGVVNFNIELESEDGSNNMEIYINYGSNRHLIECCSGMEKMMASIAIRAALINVSCISKPDIFIIDEGFGSLDHDNVEACASLLQTLKKWFKCILIISHIDAIKDTIDNMIEIEKDGIDSKIKQSS
jgi:DNA repair exonuclease SbcCD ATPase subunit/predicted phosphodiesterase